jgi:hypothetical protein
VNHSRHAVRRLIAVALTFHSRVAITHECAGHGGSNNPGQQSSQENYRGCNSWCHSQNCTAGCPRYANSHTRVGREYEDRRVIGRVVAPPSRPGLVGARAVYGAKHVSADDPRTDVVEATCDEVIINALRSTILAHHDLKSTSIKAHSCSATPPTPSGSPRRFCNFEVFAGENRDPFERGTPARTKERDGASLRPRSLRRRAGADWKFHQVR